MAEEAIIKRLPADTQICSYGEPMKVGLSMTLETVDQAMALRHALDLAIIPLLAFEKQNEPHQETPTA